MRALNPSDRGKRQHVSRDQPSEEFAQHSAGSISVMAATAGGNILDQIDDVATTDAVDGAITPSRDDDAVEDVLGNSSGRDSVLAANMELQERSHRRLDLVARTPARFPRYTRYTRYTWMGLEPVAMGRRCVTGCC